jgi:O-antigen/teichoic acid export membrane protein
MPTTDDKASTSAPSYATNILWSWAGVAVLLLSSIVFTRILILDLGKARFGIWLLATSLVEYVWMIDLGFRPATVKFSAEYRALKRWNDLNHLINTALAYSSVMGLLILLATWFGADALAAVYKTGEPDFPFLVRAVGLSWAAGLAFNIFAATTEGFQRFDLSNRTTMLMTLLRGGLSVAVVRMGYGLREMGWVLLISQFVGYALMFFYCRGIYPQMQISPALVRWSFARQILGYARQILPGILGVRFAQGSMPSVITLFRLPQYVTYYTQTQRMMDYAADAISRVGLVTAPRVAEWHARGHREEIILLTRTANRYCVTLWGLWAAFLGVFGYDLCRVWIDADFAANVSVLLPFFLVAYTLFMGQFISAAVLMGIARYQAYSLAALAETVGSVVAMALILPRFGLTAGVAAIAALMSLSRCFYLSRCFAREFEISQWDYLRSIFTRPGLLILASLGMLALVRSRIATNPSFWVLFEVGVVFAGLYSVAAFFTVVDPRHQTWLKSKLARIPVALSGAR